MINGLGVLGWGVGGIEAEAAMLGQPLSMLVPEVVGFRLHGKLPPGATATDLVLTVTQMLRKKGVVGKFVEFYGAGLSSSRWPIAPPSPTWRPNMARPWGSFPVDAETLSYLRLDRAAPRSRSGWSRLYTKAQGLFRTDATPDPVFADTLALDLGTVEPSLAGPKRPQDRVPLTQAKAMFRTRCAPARGQASRRGPAVVAARLRIGAARQVRRPKAEISRSIRRTGGVRRHGELHLRTARS